MKNLLFIKGSVSLPSDLSDKKRPVSERFKYCPDGRLSQTSDSPWFAFHSFRQYSKVPSIDEYNIAF